MAPVECLIFVGGVFVVTASASLATVTRLELITTLAGSGLMSYVDSPAVKELSFSLLQ
jgi:hypothetical protein